MDLDGDGILILYALSGVWFIHWVIRGLFMLENPLKPLFSDALMKKKSSTNPTEYCFQLTGAILFNWMQDDKLGSYTWAKDV